MTLWGGAILAIYGSSALAVVGLFLLATPMWWPWSLVCATPFLTVLMIGMAWTWCAPRRHEISFQ